MKILIVLLLALTAFAQTKWIAFFEAGETVFYYRSVKETKEGVIFEGRMVNSKEDAIHVFRMECANKKAFLISAEKGDKKYVLKTPVEVPLTENSAIAKAFEISCGTEN